MAPSLAAAAAAAVLSALLVVEAVVVGPSPGPFPAYLCRPELSDSAGGAWAFDFSPVSSLTLSASFSGYDFRLALCGVADYECNSTGQVWPYAAGVQLEGGSNCEVLSAPNAAPQWSLIDPADAQAGAILTFASARTSNSDFSKCSTYNPQTGSDDGRTITVIAACDPTLPAGNVTVHAEFEQPQCNYNFRVSTAAACPAKPAAPPSPPLPPASAPAIPTPAGYNAFPADGPFAPYLCRPTLSDASGASFLFDLSTTFSPSFDSNVTNATASGGGGTFFLSLCGFATTVCTPEYGVLSNYGSVIHSFGGAPASQSCTATNGSAVGCTPACHVLGVGAPVWGLADPANGATGGIVAVLPPAWTLASDPFQCPFDPVTLQPGSLQVALHVACDSSLPVGAVVWDSVYEAQVCAYVAVGRSAAACGVKA